MLVFVELFDLDDNLDPVFVWHLEVENQQVNRLENEVLLILDLSQTTQELFLH